MKPTLFVQTPPLAAMEAETEFAIYEGLKLFMALEGGGLTALLQAGTDYLNFKNVKNIKLIGNHDARNTH